MDRVRLAALYGVDVTYRPAPGAEVAVPEETVVAVLAALGVDASTDRAVRDALDAHEQRAAGRLLPPLTVVRAGAALPLLPEGTLLNGVPLEPGAAAPTSPGGYVLRAEAGDGRTARGDLVVAPRRLEGPPGRTFGFMAQLYSTLSSRSWGMGDLADLADLAAWSGRTLGAGFVQINPLHAAVPGHPTDPSPYRPSSRRFPDPVYLRIEDVPEYAYLPPEAREQAEPLLRKAAALRESVLFKDALIDRDAVWALKAAALELLRQVPLSPGRRAAYADFLAAQGRALDDHATWSTLAELHGPDWHSWPAGLRDPRSPQVARARGEHLDRVDFHCWLSWLTDTQLEGAQRAAKDAGMPIGVVHDLAVGVHPSGSDAWSMQHVLAAGMSVGAPPDAFNSRGQDWGLPPWRPDALAAAGYAPYRDLISRMLRHAGGLRMDHVMGLFRLWWVPQGRPPTEGTYVRYDAEAMLGLLALEAHRAGAVVIGEDLGTVEPGVREELTDRGILGTSVLWFERNYQDRDGRPADRRPLPPAAWRELCLATATTHDLPSTAARLTGEHVELRHRLGLLTRPLAEEEAADASEVAEWIAQLSRLGMLPEGSADEEAVVKAVHRFLARTPAKMVGVWLPDGVGDRRPQNLPGTSTEYPNWRLPVAGPDSTPMTLEELAASPRLHALADEVRRAVADAARRGRPDGAP
ncbi:4-alpha-glucanotransferase [Streptomyces sp. DvalAA-14]|uniref:4-alpha-glucanotransferase n=1 Tax=unclassified Streptomyces TaxID=2593676 RepID=UPI00081B4043|nr:MULTISPECIES: 4-alpha-glucanotransferase [unclassified Streptomyces]MYS24732.1 4-alpha-glucanotransferase [Streptomyces sp. SID4948]SCE48900.1 4-alpha-glucanotransferase [Streptomyces sp. DvalAA-14]